MNEADLLQIFLDVNQDIDTQFQFWISITFAVLVASFVADERLSRAERVVVTSLYLCAAMILLQRYVSALSHLDDTLRLFDESRLERPAVPRLAGLLRFVLFTLGSLVAAVSVLFPRFAARGRGSIPVRVD
ncbi:MAG: hypothetical protein AB7T31_05205 [Gemmatimonadales bacterium]